MKFDKTTQQNLSQLYTEGVIKRNSSTIKEMTIGESDDRNNIFYTFWEKFVDTIPDDVLEATVFMIDDSNALNNLIEEEYGYRNQRPE